jgi:hypothetical protein
VRLEGLGQLKNLMTSPGIEPATLGLVAFCLNQLRYRKENTINGVMYFNLIPVV